MKNLKQFKLFAPIGIAFVLGACAGASSDSTGNSGGQSNAGSTATILPYGSIAYVLDNSLLKIIDLEKTPPEIRKAIPLDSPETLFISNGYLMISTKSSWVCSAFAFVNGPIYSCFKSVIDRHVFYIEYKKSVSD